MLTKFPDLTNSNEWIDWHLTPRGWERGTQMRDDINQIQEIEPPLDRVLTCRYHQNVAINSIWVQKHVSEVWKSPNTTMVNELLDKFGSCPQAL